MYYVSYQSGEILPAGFVIHRVSCVSLGYGTVLVPFVTAISQILAGRFFFSCLIRPAWVFKMGCSDHVEVVATGLLRSRCVFLAGVQRFGMHFLFRHGIISWRWSVSPLSCTLSRRVALNVVPCDMDCLL